MIQGRPQNDQTLVFCVQFCISPPHDRIWVMHLNCSCQRDTSSRSNACPVPQLRFAVVDLDARVRQQVLLDRCVKRG